MAFTRTQIGIAVGAGVLLVLVFVGYLWWLSDQGPVLARSENRDPLTGLPVSIKMNPLRDRSTEKAANKFLRELARRTLRRSAVEVGARLPQEVREVYLQFRGAAPAALMGSGGVGGSSAADHSALPWYAGKQHRAGWNVSGLFTVTTDSRSGGWVVTKYDAMY